MTTKTDTLASAMALAFAEIEGATKDKVNPHFKSKYADLGSVIDAIKPSLSKHGLYFQQISHPSEEGVIVETVLYHGSGEMRSLGQLFMPASKKDAQGFGSALTYCRRYSLMTAFGVPAEDDDGNAASRGTMATLAPTSHAKDAPFAQGPARNRTDLKEKGRAFWRDVEACEDADQLEALLSTHGELMGQIRAELPDWWTGGMKNGDEAYTGLGEIIAKLKTDLTAAQMADDFTRAG